MVQCVYLLKETELLQQSAIAQINLATKVVV